MVHFYFPHPFWLQWFSSCYVLCPAQEFFTYMETSPIPAKGCKIWANAWRSGPLGREGSLSCHTCCETEPRFFLSHPKDHPIQSPLMTHKGMIERVHLIFLKTIFNLKSSTPSYMIYGESGRFPLYIKVYSRMITYWRKLLYSENKIANIVYI
jgi:hypothetical protein